MRRLILTFAATCLITGTAHADLKITSEVEATGMAAAGNGRTVTYIKGMKMRSDSDSKGARPMILDIEKKQMVVLNPKKKRAEVYDMSPIATQQVAIETGDATLEATGKTRTVAGYSCDEHNITMSFSAGAGAMPGVEVEITLEGPVCLSKNAPGADEFFTFYKAMAESGLFFAPPEAAQAQPGQQRGMTQLYRAMAEKGVGLASELEIGFSGSGMIGKMMKRFGSTTTTEVLEVSDAALSDDLFEIPAGYKVKHQ